MSRSGVPALITSTVTVAVLASMLFATSLVGGGDVEGAGPVRQERSGFPDWPSLLASRPPLEEVSGRVARVVSAPGAASRSVSPDPSTSTIDPVLPSGAATQVEGLVPATVTRSAARGPHAGPMPIASPDVGVHCAAGLGADDLTEFFGEPIGDLRGADYQRATRLPDDRVLWTFQDAFVGGRLVHNVGMVQSGRCFTPLGDEGRSWLLADRTDHMSRWHWILDVAVDAAGGRLHAFVVEMQERGGAYLSRTRPVALRRVVLDLASLAVLEIVDEAPTGLDLYGWSVTSDAEYTYLYSHCYRQFGFDTVLGSDPCTVDVKLARVRAGQLEGPREYWTGAGWAPSADDAVPVVDGSFAMSGNNPAQIHFDGERYHLVEKRDDWWGATVEFGVADRPEGPFRHIGSVPEPLKCERAQCNTYFASWVPWSDDGRPIWSIGHNRWDGAETAHHLATYRPTFHTTRP